MPTARRNTFPALTGSRLAVEANHAIEHIERQVFERLSRCGRTDFQASQSFGHVTPGLDGDHPRRLENAVADAPQPVRPIVVRRHGATVAIEAVHSVDVRCPSSSCSKVRGLHAIGTSHIRISGATRSAIGKERGHAQPVSELTRHAGARPRRRTRQGRGPELGEVPRRRWADALVCLREHAIDCTGRPFDPAPKVGTLLRGVAG